MTPIEHLAQLLDDHDGDDRCGCLRETIWQFATNYVEADILEEGIQRLSNCLANHPAGLTLRSRIPTSPEQLP